MAIRRAGPIHPRIKDMRLYEAAIRKTYLNPMFDRLGRRLAQAESANQAWAAMDDVVGKMAAQPRFGVPTGEIQRQLGRIEGYHRGRVKASFRAALGVDISRLLSEPEIASFMGRKISENVDLIKTIPARMHQSLKLRLSQELQKAPFDQKRVMELFRDEYGSSGYTLRRITRDQTSKTIGGLTEVRHRQLGIAEYRWITAQDERVRATHVANSGLVFEWRNPPDTGNPGEDTESIEARVREFKRATITADRKSEIRDKLREVYGGGDPDEILRGAIDRNAPYFAVKRDTLETILRSSDQEFKNGYQTGTSITESILGPRRRFERDFMGVNTPLDDASKQLSPKYGFLDSADRPRNNDLARLGYGDMYVRFKPDVKSRAPFTFDDSWNANGQAWSADKTFAAGAGPPAPAAAVTAPDIATMNHVAKYVDTAQDTGAIRRLKAGVGDASELTEQYSTIQYVEAHRIMVASASTISIPFS